MADDSDLDIFDSTEEIEQPRPRALVVIGALVGVGLLIGIAVSVTVGLYSSVTPVEAKPGSAVCGGAASCDGLSLLQVQSLTSIPFDTGSTVDSSSYVETADAITVLAEVTLPEDAENPLAVSAYTTRSEPTVEWDTAGLTVLDYYAASGEQGSLYAEAVLAVGPDGRQVVLVRVERVL